MPSTTWLCLLLLPSVAGEGDATFYNQDGSLVMELPNGMAATLMLTPEPSSATLIPMLPDHSVTLAPRCLAAMMVISVHGTLVCL